MSNNKIQNMHVCSNCDAQFSKWSGRCLECGSWGTLQMQTVDVKEKNKLDANIVPAKIIDLNKIRDKDLDRVKTNINNLIFSIIDCLGNLSNNS